MSSSQSSRPPRLPRTFWLLWTGGLINKLGDFVMPFLAIYLSSLRGLAPAQVGLVLSLFGVGSLAAGPVGGLLADRLGRRRALLFATASSAAGMVNLGLAHSVTQIAIATLLLGFFSPLYRPAQGAAIADLIEPSERPRAFALLYWAANLGFAFSMIVAGSMVKYGYRLLFVVDAATTLGFGLVVWRFVPETRPQRVASTTPSHTAVQELLVPFRDPALITFLLICMSTALCFAQVWSMYPLEMARHGIDPEEYGRLMAINGALIGLLQLGAGTLVRRFPRPVMLALSSLLVGLGFGATAWAHAWPGYAVAIVIWTMGEIIQAPVTSTVVADLAPTAWRGAYQGALVSVFSLAQCLAPIVGGFVLERLGSEYLWGGLLVGGLAAAAGHLVWGRAERARVSAVAAQAA